MQLHLSIINLTSILSPYSVGEEEMHSQSISRFLLCFTGPKFWGVYVV